MPIYAYRCEACGFAKDVLQKISEAPLTDCLSCGKPSFKKQLTAAGFQLKGSGWYVTDFRGGNTPASGAPTAADGGAKPEAASGSSTVSSNTTSSSSTSTSTTSSAPAAAGNTPAAAS